MPPSNNLVIPNWLQKSAEYLAASEFWTVGVFMAASVLSARLLPFTLMVMLAFWAVRWLAWGEVSVRTPIDWAVLLLILPALLSLWISVRPNESFVQVFRLLTGIGFFYAIANWAHNLTRARLATGMIVSAAVGLALLAPFSVEWGTEKFPLIPAEIYTRFSLLVSDAINPNVMAAIQVVIFPLVLSLLMFSLRDMGVYSRWGVLASFVLITGILALTQSRGGWMAALTVLVLIVALRWSRGWTVSLVVLGTGLLVAARMGFENAFEVVSSGGSITGAPLRLEIWSRALMMIRDFPLSGVGMGNFGEISALLYPLFLAPPGKIPHAHNIFLQVAVDLGLPGLVGWLAIWIAITLISWQVFRQSQRMGNRWLIAISAGLLGSQVALVVHGLVDAALWGMVRPAPIVWALWGLVMAAHLIVSKATLPEVRGAFTQPEKHAGR